MQCWWMTWESGGLIISLPETLCEKCTPDKHLHNLMAVIYYHRSVRGFTRHLMLTGWVSLVRVLKIKVEIDKWYLEQYNFRNCRTFFFRQNKRWSQIVRVSFFYLLEIMRKLSYLLLVYYQDMCDLFYVITFLLLKLLSYMYQNEHYH